MESAGVHFSMALRTIGSREWRVHGELRRPLGPSAPAQLLHLELRSGSSQTAQLPSRESAPRTSPSSVRFVGEDFPGRPLPLILPNSLYSHIFLPVSHYLTYYWFISTR